MAARKAKSEESTDQLSTTANSERQPGDEAEPKKKKWTPEPNPRGLENIKAGNNRVRLFKSESPQGGAYVIRFAHNPNDDTGPDGEQYSKQKPHPVLAMLKEEGYRWGFDQDGIGGWGKPFEGDPYGVDHIRAREVLAKAADMIGQKAVEQTQTPF